MTALAISSPFSYAIVEFAFIFILIPLADYAIGISTINFSSENEIIMKNNFFWQPALYFYFITHFGFLFWAILQIASANDWSYTLLLSVVVGLYTGGLGITVGHELCHKKELHLQLLADLLLASVCYQHFAVEHVRGHHYRVATHADPASARLGESAYAFWVRAVKDSFIHALEIDWKRVLWGVILSLIFALICFSYGIKVLIFFLMQSVIAFTLLELVDYIEHYGLSRKELNNGRFEKVRPIHSWNSSHIFSNGLLFNLQRHSDHHAAAHLPYSILKHHDEAPQLPSGYPGMILLALVPPLWFKVMDKKVKVIQVSS